MAASRFSVLAIDEDEDSKPTEKKSSSSAASNAKKQGNKKAVKKQKAEQERAQLVKLAFAFPKSSTPRAPTKVAESLKSSDPSELFQNEESDEELAEALKMSKLEYEESLTRYEQEKKETAAEPSKSKKKTKKKNTPVISMDQFNRPQVQTKTTNEVNGSNTDARHQEASNLSQVPADEGPRIAQLQEDLRQRDDLISQLQAENEKLRDEILSVKTRNKKLYGILGQGEMREKAELLVELEKLSKIKDELTAEVENLATQLQQEKSKVSSLAEGKKPTGNKK